MFVSTVLTYIALNVLEIYMVGEPWFSAFQNFFQIENLININKLMDRNVCISLYQLCQHTCIEYIRNLMSVLTVSRFMHFQNFFQIKNPLSINKVTDRNVCMCLVKATNTDQY